VTIARVLVRCWNAAFEASIGPDSASAAVFANCRTILPMTNEDYPFGLEAMFASTNVTVADIQAGHLTDINQLSKMDKLTATSTFAALLASPQLQANAYRLEALVHIAVATSSGRQHLTSEFVRKVFKRFGNGICGRLEDPAEDLFTTVVHSSDRNFLVFEGLREGNGFYLQRVLDVLEDIPDRGHFARMRRSVFALLALSDAVAKRAGCVHGMMGEPQPHASSDTIIFQGRISNPLESSAAAIKWSVTTIISNVTSDGYWANVKASGMTSCYPSHVVSVNNNVVAYSNASPQATTTTIFNCLVIQPPTYPLTVNGGANGVEVESQ